MYSFESKPVRRNVCLMGSQLKQSGPIEPLVVYPLAVFKQHVGYGDSTMRSARRAGLKVIRANGRFFVRGFDFVRYLDQVDQENTEAGNGDAALP